MTGLLILTAIIMLVVLAFRHHERRFNRAPQPWTDAVVDRDTQRMRHEVSILGANSAGAQRGRVGLQRLV